MKTLRWLGLWTPVFGFMLLVFLLSAEQSIPGTERLWDKLLHTVAYGVFGVLCLRAFHGGFAPLRRAPTLLAMALTLGYGAFDEIHQAFVPGRFSSVWDWVADALGFVLAVPVIGWIRRLPATSKLTAKALEALSSRDDR